MPSFEGPNSRDGFERRPFGWRKEFVWTLTWCNNPNPWFLQGVWCCHPADVHLEHVHPLCCPSALWMRHLCEDITRTGGGISQSPGTKLRSLGTFSFVQLFPATFQTGPQTAVLAGPERRVRVEPGRTKGLKSTRGRRLPQIIRMGKDSKEGRYYQPEGHPLLLCCFAVFCCFKAPIAARDCSGRGGGEEACVQHPSAYYCKLNINISGCCQPQFPAISVYQ